MDLVNFYRNSPLPSAMIISNHSRHGQGELDEMVRRKKDKDSRPTYKTIARFLQKPIEEVKQAWKVYQRLEARG